MSNLVIFSEKILIRLLSFSLTFCLSLIAFLPSLNVPSEPKFRQLKVEIVKPQSNEKCESPNPLTLVVELNKGQNIRLNREEFGKLEDTTNLEKKLAEVFKNREINGVFNDTEAEIEKSVVVRPDKTITYGEVVKLIDSLNKIKADIIWRSS
ncbi:MAG TPA: biopolymer transporter ExbD [Pyrinomonadaceae bacterium]|nr:biopolymer transporter ExbD [Pyrinomonadaceae bacterium]